MNCLNVKENIVQYMEDLLPEEEKKWMDAHFRTCSECQRELEAFSELHFRLLHAGSTNKSADFEYKVIDRIMREQNRRLKQAGGLRRRLENWRIVMKSRTVKLSAAAAVAFSLILGIGIFTNVPPVATADTFLTQAVDAASGLSSVHMKARMRSRPQDNFGSICLECDFIPVEMWKQIDDEGELRWRLEKPVRTIVMDGEATTMIVGGKWAAKIEKVSELGVAFDSWMGRLLDVRGLLDSELRQASENPVSQLVLNHEIIDGKDKILLEVEVTTDVPEDDYCRDGFIEDSDHLKVYRFDAETKLLEGFQLFVMADGGEELVFEITDIEYDTIDDSLLSLDLPTDIIMWQQPEVLPDNEKYEKMTPLEAASEFFSACKEENWDEVQKFWPMKMDQNIKMGLSGLESFSLGEPFQSASAFPGWFVPYELKVDGGRTVKGNLAIRNDNEAGRFIVDGGL